MSDVMVMVYVGRCPTCKKISAVVVDRPEHKKYVADDIAEFVASGRHVSRISLEEFHQEGMGRCGC